NYHISILVVIRLTKMRLSLFILTILPVALAAPGYGAASSFTPVTDPLPTETAYPSPSRCGGFINPQPTCPSGQICVHPLTVNPDLPGYCVGQPCGGFIAHPQHCPYGQVCVHINKIADLPGICLLKSMTCGGFTGKQCQSGW